MTKLPLRDRLLMAWELTWPLTLMDLAVVVVVHGVLDVQGETLDSLWAVAAFFVASPWVVRRALARSYGESRFVVMRGAQEFPRLSYQESLKVMWLLAWRTLVLSLAALLLVSGALRLAGVTGRDFSAGGPMENALGLSAVDAISSLVLSPFLIPGMLSKRYKGFHLEQREVGALRPNAARMRRQ